MMSCTANFWPSSLLLMNADLQLLPCWSSQAPPLTPDRPANATSFSATGAQAQAISKYICPELYPHVLQPGI